jgi:membrane-associated HD superfamily phosphohydrolase
MLTAYRIVYGLVLLAFLGNLLKSNDFSIWPVHVSILFVLAALTLCGVLVLLVGFSRLSIKLFWVIIIVWEVLFVWYAWLSPAAPFVLHELHSLDAKAMSEESTTHYIWASTLFVLLFAWFLSLPFARLVFRPAT